MIKLVHEKPPNWEEVKRNFPAVDWDKGVIVTYGNKCYCKYPLEQDFLIHEDTHRLQQERMGVKAWWIMYFNSPDFRLAQEFEAYQRQLQAIKNGEVPMNRHYRRERILHCAKALSSEMYGGIISFKEAKELLTS